MYSHVYIDISYIHNVLFRLFYSHGIYYKLLHPFNTWWSITLVHCANLLHYVYIFRFAFNYKIRTLYLSADNHS